MPFHTVRSKKGPKNDQMIRDPHIICESHNQPKKTVQSSKHWHLGRNRLLLWTKNALREKSFTKLGYNSGNVRKKTFSIDVVKMCLPQENCRKYKKKVAAPRGPSCALKPLGTYFETIFFCRSARTSCSTSG